MQRDHTLAPVEGLRLAALGFLARSGPMTYAALATEVRLFATSYGASPVDVMSSSIELLRFEGFVTIGGETGEPGEAIVTLTGEGRAELQRLLRAPVRLAGGWARLLTALKMRFLHMLDDEQRAVQAELLADALQGELARLEALRRRMADEDPDFVAWMDRDIERVAAELAWFSARAPDAHETRGGS